MACKLTGETNLLIATGPYFQNKRSGRHRHGAARRGINILTVELLVEQYINMFVKAGYPPGFMSETAHTENLLNLVNLGYYSCRYFGLMAHNLHYITLRVFIYIVVLNSLLCH